MSIRGKRLSPVEKDYLEQFFLELLLFGRSHTFIKIGGFSIIPILKENAIGQYTFTPHHLILT